MVTSKMSDNYQQRNTTKKSKHEYFYICTLCMHYKKKHIPIPDGNEWKEPCLMAKI